MTTQARGLEQTAQERRTVITFDENVFRLVGLEENLKEGNLLDFGEGCELVIRAEQIVTMDGTYALDTICRGKIERMPKTSIFFRVYVLKEKDNQKYLKSTDGLVVYPFDDDYYKYDEQLKGAGL